jgi:GDP-L-fucose synthase
VADLRDERVFVAGHRGMVGSAIVRRLQALGCAGIVTAERGELDLRVQSQVQQFFGDRRIDRVVLAAARVGGIHANDAFPADFILDNLLIEAHVVGAAHAAGVGQLLLLGSSCIYPRDAAQPMRESALLTGALEPTNEPYAIAKIAGIKLCESFERQHGRDYRCVMPTNLYGPGDNFHPEHSHVIPSLMRRFHEAARDRADAVTVWGSGTPRREFLHVDDAASACVHLMQVPVERWRSMTQPRCRHVNVGTGGDCTIRELAETLARITGFEGRLQWDPSRPDGAPRKLLDVTRLHRLGWRAAIGLEDGLRDTYRWFVDHHDRVRT